MLVNIGDGLFDPSEVVALYPLGDGHQSRLVLRNGAVCPVISSYDEAKEDLSEAGIYIDPKNPPVPKLTTEEHEELSHLYALGFTYIARDADGRLYAYSDPPRKSGAYWTGTDNGDQKRMQGDFDFITEDAAEPWLISALL